MLLYIVFVIVLVTYFVNQLKRPFNYPPGPPWWPVLGNLPLLKQLSIALKGQHLALSELANKYKTKILGLKLGNEYTIVVFSYDIIKTVLTEEVYEGRPKNFFMKLRSMNTNKGITGTDGDFWNAQRHFLVRHLRNVGFGKKTMDFLISDEISEFLNVLKNNSNDTPIGILVAPSVINIIWALTTGSRIPRDDIRLEKLLKLLHLRAKAFDMSGGTLNIYPWLRFLAPEKTGYNLINKLNKELHNLFMETIIKHHNLWTQDKEDDIIFSFITEMKKGNKTFTDDQLVMICLDLFIAGSQTTSNTLDFAFLMMILHPEIQAKVQNHLDEAFKMNEPIQYADRHKVPYVEAVLWEIQRFCHVVPIIGPRRVLKDTCLEGYYIPKDTTVLISVFSIHNDKDFWKDPENFRPDRFLDESGKLKNHDRVITFGLGRRRCLGEVLAKSCIFTFFAETMRKYTVSVKPNAEKPSSIPMPGITLSPQPYKARFVERR